MSNRSMGQTISALRKEKGMTQKDLADLLHITDKAVSKWERDVACPDTQTIPKLAEILEISVEELLNAKPAAAALRKGTGDLFDLILKAIPIAMGVAVTVSAVFGELSLRSGFAMLGIGLACVGISLLSNNH